MTSDLMPKIIQTSPTATSSTSSTPNGNASANFLLPAHSSAQPSLWSSGTASAVAAMAAECAGNSAAANMSASSVDPAAARIAALSAAAAAYPGNLAACMGAAPGVYAAASGAASYPSSEQNPYQSISIDNPFYSSLGSPYGLKDGTAGMIPGGDIAGTAWASTGLPPSAYYSYDHSTLAAYAGYGSGYDLAARRKNATRESTATLKGWLNEHKKNPYPTKGEKIMLAIITKMTLTQVSTWFANARRRLKKENKMTWEPKNKLDDEDADISDDDDIKDGDTVDSLHHHHSMLSAVHLGGSRLGSSLIGDDPMSVTNKMVQGGIPIPPSKPKIWSLADTAVCKTPPPSSTLPQLQAAPQSAAAVAAAMMISSNFSGIDFNNTAAASAMAAAAVAASGTPSFPVSASNQNDSNPWMLSNQPIVSLMADHASNSNSFNSQSHFNASQQHQALNKQNAFEQQSMCGNNALRESATLAGSQANTYNSLLRFGSNISDSSLSQNSNLLTGGNSTLQQPSRIEMTATASVSSASSSPNDIQNKHNSIAHQQYVQHQKNPLQSSPSIACSGGGTTTNTPPNTPPSVSGAAAMISMMKNNAGALGKVGGTNVAAMLSVMGYNQSISGNSFPQQQSQFQLQQPQCISTSSTPSLAAVHGLQNGIGYSLPSMINSLDPGASATTLGTGQYF